MEVLKHLCNLMDVAAAAHHVISALKQPLAVKFPALIPPRLLYLLTHLEICVLPVLEHLTSTLNALLGIGRLHSENTFHVKLRANVLGQLKGNALHERHHPLVCVVVPRNYPHHTDGIHHWWNRVPDLAQRSQ